MQGDSRTLEEVMQRAQIAVKQVQMQKLTKEERKLYRSGIAVSNALALFWTWLIIGGGMFSSAMVGVCVLLVVLISAMLGDWTEIPSLMGSIPLGWIFVFCWLGYGLPMGVVALAAKHR